MNCRWAMNTMIGTATTCLPHERFRALKGRVVRRGLKRKESAEDRAASPSRLVR
jgi:hypothetical protein